jgi:hypothetical protein
MAKREDTSIRESLTRLLPPVKIRRLAVETGALERRRKVDVACFVYRCRSSSIAASTSSLIT